MSFDARSLERLQELGRSLPQPLPTPPKATTAPLKASEQRHRVETETDPEALFRELMQVSPDGTVPPHLLDRLKQAEADRRLAEQQAQRQARLQRTRSSSAGSSASGTLRPLPGRRQANGADELELYSAFQQLLLEDEDDTGNG
jgi:hypothetical protein